MDVRALLLAVALSSACASGPRLATQTALEKHDVRAALAEYENVRRSDGPDRELLAAIAREALIEHARAEDPAVRQAAVRELSTGGHLGLEALRLLARDDSPSGFAALEALARRDDDDAQRLVLSFADSDNPELRALAVLGMSVDHDRVALFDALASPVSKVRAVAAERLAGAAPEWESRLALETASRVDPEAEVRVAAVRALGSFGGEAIPALRERLSDPAASVRLAAVGALVRADFARAEEILGPLFAIAPSSAGIEASRMLLARKGEGDEAQHASAYLRAALSATDSQLRAQAAVALAGLSDGEAYDEALRAAFEREREPAVVLQLAGVLIARESTRALSEAALARLLSGHDMVALQSAAILAEHDHRAAISLLIDALENGDALLRATAARALCASAHRPDDVRALLVDQTESVSIAVAGAILSAALRE